MRTFLPVVLSFALLVGMIALLFSIPVDSTGNGYVATTTSSPPTTIGNITASWGHVSAPGFKVPDQDSCAEVTIDVVVDSMEALGRADRYVKFVGYSGQVYAVSAATLVAGSNPIVMRMCRNQEVKHRVTVEAPWGPRDFTVNYVSSCTNSIKSSTLDDDSIVLTIGCPPTE